MGIIDTLTAGFDLVRKRLWLLLLPIALDVVLWVAPKLSVFSLLRNLWHAFLAEGAASGATASAMWQNMQEMLPDLVSLARSIDLTLLVPLSSLGVPVYPVAETTSFFGLSKQAIELPGGMALVAVVLGLCLLGLLAGAFYMALIAHIVREGRVDWPQLVHQVPHYWRRLLGAGLVLMTAIAVIGMPASMVIGVFALLSPGLASILVGVLSFLIFWIMLYMAFVPEAIVYSEDGVLKALWRSAIIVRTSFWPALGLLLLSYIISAGLGFLWDLLAVSPAGTLVALVGSAFVGTGLTAALFMFYRERLRAPMPTVEPRRS